MCVPSKDFFFVIVVVICQSECYTGLQTFSVF